MKLYDLNLSGNSYKVRLMLSLLEVEHEIQPVNLLGGEHKEDAFLSLNPKGQVPVLQDGDFMLSDSQAILVYLARKYQAEDLYPLDAVSQGEIAYWLSTAANEVAHGVAAARLVKLFGFALDYEVAKGKAAEFLGLLEKHLDNRAWLVGSNITIADVAVFPYVALAPDGEIGLEEYPNIQAWIQRIEGVPNYVALPKK